MVKLFKVFMAASAEAAVGATLDSGYIGQGPQVEEFEKQLRILEDLPRAPLATCSGTAALDLAYHLVGIHEGSEVICTPMTCSATVMPLVNRGARIHWADVSPVTGLIDSEDVLRKVSPRTVAIIAVDWAGRPANYEALRAIGPPVIQDGAHSRLSRAPMGDYRMWSFQAIKFLTTGDGGALLVPEEQQERADLLRWYGLDRHKGLDFRCAQDVLEAGYKSGMNDIAASIGLSNMYLIEDVVNKHRDHAALYDRCFPEDSDKVKKPEFVSWSSWWLYTLRVDNQARFIAHMAKWDIEASPVHSRVDTKTVMRAVSENWSEKLPGVNQFAYHEVCIPVGWWLTEADLQRVIDAVTDYV